MAAAVASMPPFFSPESLDISRGVSAQDAPKLPNFTANLQQGLNNLVANPITFVEAEDANPTIQPTSNMLVLDDALLQPPPDAPVVSEPASHPISISPSSSPPAPSQDSNHPPLYAPEISHTWIKSAADVGRGLYNNGNTCFLNSVLQCLVHTPALLRIISVHVPTSCQNKGFCMMCRFRAMAVQAIGTNAANSQVRCLNPNSITTNLKNIAKNLRLGRQEDAHEFLRYSIDAFQRAALYGTDPKLPHSVKETTWVHKLFGGRLRSRVICFNCKSPSDTFDSLLDLSIDVRDRSSVREALDAFIAVDLLYGSDKYKCEMCKKPVVAAKQFTIHDAPQVLTIHLKRFTPLGRKMNHPVRYDEHISLTKYMSAGQFGPRYSLYGVISHAGSGPNSGHYYAHIKSKSSSWYEMNDESVSPSKVPLGLKNAYILFYQRDQGQALEQAVSAPVLAAAAEIVPRAVLGAGKKRKAEEDEEEDIGVKATALSLPVDPAVSPIFKMPKFDVPIIPQIDPAAATLSAKIKAAKTPTPSPNALTGLSSLMEYGGDTSSGPDDFEPEPEPVASSSKTLPSPLLPAAPPRAPSPSDYYPAEPPTSSTPLTNTTTTTAGPRTIDANSFYGKSSQDRFEKRRHSDENARNDRSIHHRLAGKSKARRKDRRDFNSPFSKNALRGNLGEDRSGASTSFTHRPNGLSAKDRMRPKKHMLI